MRIVINDKPLNCTESLTLRDLLTELDQQGSGTAVAVRQQIVPRDRWDQTHLQDGDTILIFNVIAGG